MYGEALLRGASYLAQISLVFVSIHNSDLELSLDGVVLLSQHKEAAKLRGENLITSSGCDSHRGFREVIKGSPGYPG